MITSLHLHRRSLFRVAASAAVSVGVPCFVSARRDPASRRETARTHQTGSVILVNLTGGMSQLDSLDMKPEAPAEIRGEFKPIDTTVPGVQVCEHLPLLAKSMHRWALVRSLSHGENGHLPGTHRLLTGATMPNQRITDLDNVLSRRDWPCYAAGLNTLRPRTDGLPSGVTLPHALIEGPLTWPGQHAGILGPKHDPLFVKQDPNSDSFQMDEFRIAEGSSVRRVHERASLLERLDASTVHDGNFTVHQHQAIELLTSASVASAFELQRETPTTRDRYGRTQFGQSLLLARRLVEAGVPMIQANMGIVQSWDTHVDNWGRLKNRLLPWLDRALLALIDDLQASGLLETTLVVVTGEFGRTPKVSNLPGEAIPGRDHWASAYSGLFTGGGVVPGRVIGKTDAIAARPVTTSYTPFDIGATIYQALGIDPESEIRDTQDRPTRVCSGTPMSILFENR